MVRKDFRIYENIIFLYDIIKQIKIKYSIVDFITQKIIIIVLNSN